MRIGQIRRCWSRGGCQVRKKEYYRGHSVIVVVCDGQLGCSFDLAAVLVVGVICCVRLSLWRQLNSDVAKASPVGRQSLLDGFLGCESKQQHQRVGITMTSMLDHQTLSKLLHLVGHPDTKPLVPTIEKSCNHTCQRAAARVV